MVLTKQMIKRMRQLIYEKFPGGVWTNQDEYWLAKFTRFLEYEECDSEGQPYYWGYAYAGQNKYIFDFKVSKRLRDIRLIRIFCTDRDGYTNWTWKD